MSMDQELFAKIKIAHELLGFLWKQKLWWMIPMMIVLLFFGIVLITVQGSSIAPFIYVLF